MSDGFEPAALARRFEDAEHRGGPCRLDLGDEAIAGTASPSAVRLSIPQVMILSNLLVGRFRDVPVEIRLPESTGLNRQLARGGFFFALANRSGVSWFDAAPEEWERIAREWVNPFHPSDVGMLRTALVDVKDPENDSWVLRTAFQPYLLSVMHPHNRPALHLRRELQQIAGRWLTKRLNSRLTDETEATLKDCMEIFYQIIVNVADHAGLRRASTGCSLGQVYATLGGGRDSHNRLHFMVLDNGVGLPHRVGVIYKDRIRGAGEAIRDAVMGRLPRRAGGRGTGLDSVRRIAGQYAQGRRDVGGASSIHMVTNGDTDDSAVCLRWRSSSSDPEVSRIAGLPIRGCLVWVSLGLERRTSDADSNRLNTSDADSLQLKLTPTEPVTLTESAVR